jgi:hypothetical protein
MTLEGSPDEERRPFLQAPLLGYTKIQSHVFFVDYNDVTSVACPKTRRTAEGFLHPPVL